MSIGEQENFTALKFIENFAANSDLILINSNGSENPSLTAEAFPSPPLKIPIRALPLHISSQECTKSPQNLVYQREQDERFRASPRFRRGGHEDQIQSGAEAGGFKEEQRDAVHGAL